ncbi:MAG: Smr/MutS family protein [Flavobacteriales bacterium]|nr:Smr/MutS family protein [Flavobacteriales bacterium]
MNFKIGDKVRFLNSDGHGIITKILDLERVELENNFGFLEEYKISELVPERKQEDYQTENLAFDKEIKSKINAEKTNNKNFDLKREFRHLQRYGSKEIVVLDLHIENLIDSHNGMSNSAILKIQMTHFKTFLNKSIDKKQRKIVVIHGVGEGVLRHEIRKELDIYHPYFEYYDASYDEFGYGATEIRLIKKPN